MNHDVKLERLFDASLEVVFGGFTALHAQKELNADAPGWIVESECDLRVGGQWTIGSGASANPVGSRDQRVPSGRLAAAPGLPLDGWACRSRAVTQTA